MPQAPKSDAPPAESTSLTIVVNALTLPALLELNYRLRSRAVSDSDHGGAEALAVGLNSRVQNWLDEQHNPTQDPAAEPTPPAEAEPAPNREPSRPLLRLVDE
jgi:hypothetical protein